MDPIVAQARIRDRFNLTTLRNAACDCHEALNFSANLDIPVVFLCQNNGWAISVPTKIQCSAPTLAQRGMAYGMHCVQCDGNDLFAVVRVVREAAERARVENRPTFIEALTYRLGDHTTADDARRYREQAELDKWEKRDPIMRLRQYLSERKLWSDKKEKTLQARAKEEVVAVVKRATDIADPTSNDMFETLLASISADQHTQRTTLRTSSLGQDPSPLEGAGRPGIEEAV